MPTQPERATTKPQSNPSVTKTKAPSGVKLRFAQQLTDHESEIEDDDVVYGSDNGAPIKLPNAETGKDEEETEAAVEAEADSDGETEPAPAETATPENGAREQPPIAAEAKAPDATTTDSEASEGGLPRDTSRGGHGGSI